MANSFTYEVYNSKLNNDIYRGSDCFPAFIYVFSILFKSIRKRAYIVIYTDSAANWFFITLSQQSIKATCNCILYSKSQIFKQENILLLTNIQKNISKCLLSHFVSEQAVNYVFSGKFKMKCFSFSLRNSG